MGWSTKQKSLSEAIEGKYEPVTESGCWIWTGGCHDRGYGWIQSFRNGRKKVIRAHRASYEIHKGPIPDGAFVCHHCDIPSCINPDHLYIGDYKSNAQDKVRRNRMNPAKGERQGNSILKEWQVLYLRSSERTETIKTLSERWGISVQTLYSANEGRTWKHL